jgi:hypothetical protein
MLSVVDAIAIDPHSYSVLQDGRRDDGLYLTHEGAVIVGVTVVVTGPPKIILLSRKDSWRTEIERAMGTSTPPTDAEQLTVLGRELSRTVTTS